MTRTHYCPVCRRPLEVRAVGQIRLSPRKTLIFNAIKDNPGITLGGILGKCFEGYVSASTVYQHIYQINDALKETEYYISGNQLGKRGSYWVMKRGDSHERSSQIVAGGR
jgi:hypothetical protein